MHIVIRFLPAAAAITLAWAGARAVCAIRSRKIDLKHELKLLLVYATILMVTRFVYFEYYGLSIASLKYAHATIDTSLMFPPFYNLKPLNGMSMKYGGWEFNMIGNVLMFIPVGIFWPLCFEKLDNILKVTLVGALYSLLIEISQLFFWNRCTDIDDLIFNTAGAFVGACVYFLAKVLKGKLRTNQNSNSHII